MVKGPSLDLPKAADGSVRAILEGPRTPEWTCPNCATTTNWRCRVKCNCGELAPIKIRRAALKAHKAEVQRRAEQKEEKRQKRLRGKGEEGNPPWAEEDQPSKPRRRQPRKGAGDAAEGRGGDKASRLLEAIKSCPEIVGKLCEEPSMQEFKSELGQPARSGPEGAQPGKRDTEQIAKLVAKKSQEIAELQKAMDADAKLKVEIERRAARQEEVLAAAKVELQELREEQTRAIISTMEVEVPSVKMLAGVFKVPEDVALGEKFDAEVKQCLQTLVGVFSQAKQDHMAMVQQKEEEAARQAEAAAKEKEAPKPKRRKRAGPEAGDDVDASDMDDEAPADPGAAFESISLPIREAISAQPGGREAVLAALEAMRGGGKSG